MKDALSLKVDSRLTVETHYPANFNEIAISSQVADYFLENGFSLNPNTKIDITSVDQLINKSYIGYTITAIYNVANNIFSLKNNSFINYNYYFKRGNYIKHVGSEPIENTSGLGIVQTIKTKAIKLTYDYNQDLQLLKELRYMSNKNDLTGYIGPEGNNCYSYNIQKINRNGLDNYFINSYDGVGNFYNGIISSLLCILSIIINLICLSKLFDRADLSLKRIISIQGTLLISSTAFVLLMTLLINLINGLSLISYLFMFIYVLVINILFFIINSLLYLLTKRQISKANS